LIMRWLVNSNGQTSGPMEEAMLAALVKAGQIAADAMVREETDIAWEPIAQTKFAVPSAQSADALLPRVKTKQKPWFDPNNLTFGQGLLAVIGILGFAVAGVTTLVHEANDDPVPPLPAAPEAVATPTPEPAPPTHGELLARTADLSTAIAILKPDFELTGEGNAPAAALLATWSGLHMTWPALQKIPETQKALVMKEPAAEVGKRLCWSGSVFEISTDHSAGYQVYDGGIMGDDGGIVRFFAVGSSGDIVEHSWARVCGIVTGAVAYPNSGGGTTHGVHVVGMFDLPKNKAGYAPASAR
jgi:GYF domain 2